MNNTWRRFLLSLTLSRTTAALLVFNAIVQSIFRGQSQRCIACIHVYLCSKRYTTLNEPMVFVRCRKKFNILIFRIESGCIETAMEIHQNAIKLCRHWFWIEFTALSFSSGPSLPLSFGVVISNVRARTKGWCTA